MRRALYALTAVLALSLFGFSLWSWPRRVDERSAIRYERQLRALLALDYRLNAEISKSRADMSANYDGLVQTAAARKRAYQELRRFPSCLRGQAADEIRNQLAAGEKRRAESERAIEQWKRDNTVLHNSLRALPELARELESVASGSEHDARASELIRDALLLQTASDPALRARMALELESLRSAEQHATEAERARLGRVLAHARLVYDNTPVVQQLTRTILGLDGSSGTQAMLTAFEHSRQTALAIANQDANVRFALALLTIVTAAASVLVRLRHTSEELRTAQSELQRAAASLQVEQAKQRELSDLKSRFVSMVSHQFRTPLSVIISSTEMLEAYGEHWSTEKKREYFERLRYEAYELTRMLDAILTIGSQEQGLLRFEPRPIEIDPFCGDVLAAIGDATGQRNRVVYHGTGSKEPVVADPTLLRKMLENLLTNALKYSPQDTDVELNVERDEHELRFEVNDHGIGIDSDDLRHMFETFYRGRNVGNVAGTGLGLSIVRGAVELHGGQVAVRSQPAVGTSFMISIPCVRNSA